VRLPVRAGPGAGNAELRRAVSDPVFPRVSAKARFLRRSGHLTELRAARQQGVGRQAQLVNRARNRSSWAKRACTCAACSTRQNSHAGLPSSVTDGAAPPPRWSGNSGKSFAKNYPATIGNRMDSSTTEYVSRRRDSCTPPICWPDRYETCRPRRCGVSSCVSVRRVWPDRQAHGFLKQSRRQ